MMTPEPTMIEDGSGEPGDQANGRDFMTSPLSARFAGSPPVTCAQQIHRFLCSSRSRPRPRPYWAERGKIASKKLCKIVHFRAAEKHAEKAKKWDEKSRYHRTVLHYVVSGGDGSEITLPIKNSGWRNQGLGRMSTDDLLFLLTLLFIFRVN